MFPLCEWRVGSRDQQVLERKSSNRGCFCWYLLCEKHWNRSAIEANCWHSLSGDAANRCQTDNSLAPTTSMIDILRIIEHFRKWGERASLLTDCQQTNSNKNCARNASSWSAPPDSIFCLCSCSLAWPRPWSLVVIKSSHLRWVLQALHLWKARDLKASPKIEITNHSFSETPIVITLLARKREDSQSYSGGQYKLPSCPTCGQAAGTSSCACRFNTSARPALPYPLEPLSAPEGCQKRPEYSELSLEETCQQLLPLICPFWISVHSWTWPSWTQTHQLVVLKGCPSPSRSWSLSLRFLPNSTFSPPH